MEKHKVYIGRLIEFSQLAKKGPRHMDLYIRVRFAFLPVKLDNGTKVWLTEYSELYRFYQGPWSPFSKKNTNKMTLLRTFKNEKIETITEDENSTRVWKSIKKWKAIVDEKHPEGASFQQALECTSGDNDTVDYI